MALLGDSSGFSDPRPFNRTGWLAVVSPALSSVRAPRKPPASPFHYGERACRAPGMLRSPHDVNRRCEARLREPGVSDPSPAPLSGMVVRPIPPRTIAGPPAPTVGRPAPDYSLALATFSPG